MNAELWLRQYDGEILYAGLVDYIQLDDWIEFDIDYLPHRSEYLTSFKYSKSIHLCEVGGSRLNRKHYRRGFEIARYERFEVGDPKRSYVDEYFTVTITLMNKDRIDPNYLSWEFTLDHLKMMASEADVFRLRFMRWLRQYDPTQYDRRI